MPNSVLEKEFNHIELEIGDPPFADWSQMFRIWTELKYTARSRSLEESLSAKEYSMRLQKALSFLEVVQIDISPDVAEEDAKSSILKKYLIWEKKHSRFFIRNGPGKEYKPFNREYLEQAIASYLQTPWMQSNELEWIFVDSMVYDEMVSFRAEILNGTALGKPNFWWFREDEKPPISVNILIMLWSLLKFIAIYIAWPATALFFLLGHQETGIGTALATGFGLYVVYKCSHILLRRYLPAELQQTNEEKLAKLLLDMNNLYNLLTPPILSPRLLKLEADKLSQNGAVFKSSVHVFIDLWMARNPDFFLVKNNL